MFSPGVRRWFAQAALLSMGPCGRTRPSLAASQDQGKATANPSDLSAARLSDISALCMTHYKKQGQPPRIVNSCGIAKFATVW